MLLVDPLGAMLLGMGLFKGGFLSGQRSYATYLWTAAIGFLIAERLYIVGMLKSYHSGFSLLTQEKWLMLPYYLTREAGALAIISVILLVVKAGLLRPFQEAQAAVGKTAITTSSSPSGRSTSRSVRCGCAPSSSVRWSGSGAR